MSEGKDKQDFIRKHQPLTTEKLKQEILTKEEAKKVFSTNAVELEKELDNFNKITEPLVNPITNKAMCWVRRPTLTEYENILPTELLQYKNDPDKMPQELLEKYNDLTFNLMATVIENPKHDSKWWKAHATMEFIELFNSHLANLFQKLEKDTANF